MAADDVFVNGRMRPPVQNCADPEPMVICTEEIGNSEAGRRRRCFGGFALMAQF